MTLQWCALRTEPGRERATHDHQDAEPFERYLPMVEHRAIRRCRVVRYRRPLFAGYLFVRVDRAGKEWPALLEIPHAYGLLRSAGGTIGVIPDEQVAMLRALESESGSISARNAKRFGIGDLARVIEGPFTSFNATVRGYKSRVVLDRWGDEHVEHDAVCDVWIFGRPTKMVLSENALEAVA